VGTVKAEEAAILDREDTRVSGKTVKARVETTNRARRTKTDFINVIVSV